MSVKIAGTDALADIEDVIVNTDEFVDQAFIEKAHEAYDDIVEAYPTNMGKGYIYI